MDKNIKLQYPFK